MLYLLDATADVNSTSSRQLNAAISQKQEPAAFLLLKHGAIQMLLTQEQHSSYRSCSSYEKDKCYASTQGCRSY